MKYVFLISHAEMYLFYRELLSLPSILQHDSGIECTPGESKQQDLKEKGNYIMYARATSGDKTNNNKFSICSIRNISAVLIKKRDACFVGKSSLLIIFGTFLYGHV